MNPGSRPQMLDSGIVDVEFGVGVKIVRPANLNGCTIGDGTFIGPFTEAQRDVRIGRNCKIQSHTFICDRVAIGDESFVGDGVVFVNDTFQQGGPAGGDRTKWRPTRIGSRVSIGSNATILPVTVADGTVIRAGAVATREISHSGVYAGNPARALRLFGE